MLGSDVFARKVDWTKVHLFWGDERCVPPSSPESNYRMVKESLLARLAVPERNIHRIIGELQPREAALHYEQKLEDFFGLVEDQFPVFDIVLLGLGEDGHTASLFPSHSVLHEHARLAIEVFVTRIAQHRVTLTLPVLNNALTVLFCVSGTGKAHIVREVLEGDTSSYPAQLIQPASGQLYWLVDREAASQLRMENHS